MPYSPSESSGPPLARFVHPTAAQNPSFAVHDLTVRIGQGSQNDIVLDDDTVSTNHARLEYTDGGWQLTDLGSKNGTYLAGARLDPEVRVPLPENSTVAFGAMKLRFELEAGVQPDAVVRSAPAPGVSVSQRKTSFRLPVWLFFVILIVLAIAVFLLVSMLGDPGINQPGPAVTPAILLDAAVQPMAA